MDTPEQVAKTLKKCILESFESMMSFAKELGISTTNLSNLVSGKKYLSPKNAFKFSNYLDLNPRYLMTGEPPVDDTSSEIGEIYSYSIKPKLLSSLKLSPDEKEFIDLALKHYNINKFYQQVQISFFNNEDRLFERMISAALSLASRLIDSTVLEHEDMIEFLSVDHGPHFMIYNQYYHFLDDLLIKSNFKHTLGYIQFELNPRFIDKTGWKQE